MASTLTRFGYLCREIRTYKDRTMGDQATALDCEVHQISAIETGKAEPSSEYIEKFRRWLNLNDSQYRSLVRRSKDNVIDLRQRFPGNDKSTSMRLFRKISNMKPAQIRKLGGKIRGEAENDRRLSGPPEIR